MAQEETPSLLPSPSKDETAAPPAQFQAPTQLPPANPAGANSNNLAKSEDTRTTSSDERDTKLEGADNAAVFALPILSTLAAISNTVDDGDEGGGVAAPGAGDGSDGGKGEGEEEGEGEEAFMEGQHGELHVSSKYTKEELMARHWGMSTEQMKRVKALLRLGVCEEDLIVADRLLKLGRDTSQDKAWTKEEQLLGYTSEQRQRMKALHTLGLTEAAFDKCRAIMLSSLGPSAFGVDADETAASAARAAKEEEWTPNGNPRNVHQNAGGVQNLLRKKSLQHQGFLEYKGGQVGGGVQLRSIVSADGVRVAKGTDEGLALPHGDQWRRASDSLKGLQLPNIQTGMTNLGSKEPRAKDMIQPTMGGGGGKAPGGLLALTARTDPG